MTGLRDPAALNSPICKQHVQHEQGHFPLAWAAGAADEPHGDSKRCLFYASLGRTRTATAWYRSAVLFRVRLPT